MASNAVPGFLPSRNGFHFANRWPAIPAFWFGIPPVRVGIGNVADGLCGGMCFAVRDRFERAETVPDDTVSPAAGSQFFAEIARRQVDSFDRIVLGPLRFLTLSALHPDRRTWWSRLLGFDRRPVITVRDEWPRIRADIDLGRLSMIGLVRRRGWSPLQLGRNHQVMAWGYEVTKERLVLRIYDPNWPDRDDIELRVALSAAPPGDDDRPNRLSQGVVIEQSTGEPLFAFFRAAYSAPG